MFDAQVQLAALGPPQYKDLNGVVHTGAIVGTDHWLRLHVLLRGASKGGRDLEIALRAITRAFFPHPWWKVWEHSVEWHIWQLPPVLRAKAIWDFMQSQAKATGVALTEVFPGTSLTELLPFAPPASPSADSPTPG